jgi:predicted amidohydrolase
MMTFSSTIAAVQYRTQPLANKQTFWDHIRHQVHQAKEQGVKLIVFPEYLTANLLALAPVMSTLDARPYLDQFTDEYIETFTQMSRDTGVTILGGTHIYKEKGRYYNGAFLFDPYGHVNIQKKVHLTPEERKSWELSHGDDFAVFDTEAGRAAILICYDIEFPEGARIVADQGADMILCPSYTDAAAGYYRVRFCSQARAIENQLYVALSGIISEMPGIPQIDVGYSQAGIFTPCDHPFPADGILALGRGDGTMMVTHELDLQLLRENRTHGQVSPYYDRRPEVYSRSRKGVNV